MFGDPLPPALSAVFPITVQQRDVDPSTEIVILEGNLVGFVEEFGVEHDGPIGSIGNLDRFGTNLLEPGENLRLVFVIVVLLKIPVAWRFLVVHDQPAGFLIEIGLIRCNPKIDVDCCGVCMDVEAATRTIVFKSPGLGEPVLLKDTGEFQP
jgi:hypothetical protein